MVIMIYKKYKYNFFLLSILIFSCSNEPRVKINFPKSNDILRKSFEIQINVNDNDSISYVGLFINGDSTKYIDYSEPYSFYINSIQFKDGSKNELLAYAYDNDRNRGISDTIIIEIDNSKSYPEEIEIESISFLKNFFQLNWENKNIKDFKNYNIERASNSQMKESKIIAKIDSQKNNFYFDKDADESIFNYYRVNLIDSLGFESKGQIKKSAIYPLPKPSEIKEIIYDLDTMKITWDKNNSENFLNYKILYGDYISKKDTIAIIKNKSINFHKISTRLFPPSKKNTFKILIENQLGQKIESKEKSNKVDPKPNQISIKKIEYDLKRMKVVWNISTEKDFGKYQVLKSKEKNGVPKLLAEYDNFDAFEHSISNFDPTIENWFFIKVVDHWGLSSLSESKSNFLDKLPDTSTINLIDYDSKNLIVHWDKFSDDDFLSYEILYSNKEFGDKVLLKRIFDINQLSFKTNKINPTQKNWFWIKNTDFWGQNSVSSSKTNEIKSNPTFIAIDSVWFNGKRININWKKSNSEYFSYYELFWSNTEFGDKKSIIKLFDKNRTFFSSENFNSFRENWFSIDNIDNWGNKTSGISVSNNPNYPPKPISIIDINYDLKILNIKWNKSQDSDFKYYNLFFSNENHQKINKIRTFYSIEDTFFQFIHDSTFNPSSSKSFFIEVVDLSGQSTVGPPFQIIDKPPMKSILNSIEYRRNNFLFSWNSNNDDDFLRYKLYQSENKNMKNEELIFTSDNVRDTIFTLKGVDFWETKYYRIETEDIWNLKTSSKIVMGSSNSMFYAIYNNIHHQKGHSAVEAFDGGFVIAGQLYNKENNDDIFIKKINPKGVEDWMKTFGGKGDDHAYSIKKTNDNGYIIAGFSEALKEKQGDIWVIKTDRDGTMEWNRTYGGFQPEKAYDINQTYDDGYIIVGNSFSHVNSSSDIWLIKIDSNGFPVWNKTFGDSTWEVGHSVNQKKDLGFIITGYKQDIQNELINIWVVNTDINGDLIWEKSLEIENNSIGYYVDEIEDGGFVVLGSTESVLPIYKNTIFAKINLYGDLIWKRRFGGKNWNSSSSFTKTFVDGFVIAGSSKKAVDGNSSTWILKLDLNGKEVWKTFFVKGFDIEVTNIINSKDGGYFITGYTKMLDGSNNLVTIKTDFNGKISN